MEVYLGGPIRWQNDFIEINNDDISWRLNIRGFLRYYQITANDPCQWYIDRECKQLKHGELQEIYDNIFKEDLRLLNKSDFGIFHLNAFPEYPTFGSTAEIGYYLAQNKLCHVITDYNKFKNNIMFKGNCIFHNSLEDFYDYFDNWMVN